MAVLDEILQNFETRLSALEAKMGVTPAAAQKPAAPSPSPASEKLSQPQKPAAASSTTNPTAQTSGAGSFFGLVGIAFLLLGAAFFVKLTIDSGWLTPEKQIFLAAFFGILCLALPHFLQKLGEDYGSLLSGAGVAVLHISWFAAYRVHNLIEPSSAILAATAVGVLAVLSNAHKANAIFVLMAVAGTYLSMPLLGLPLSDLKNLSSFLLIWNLSFSTLAFFLKRRDVLFVAAYFAVLLVGLLSLQGNILSSTDFAMSFLELHVLQFVIFAIGTLAFSLVHRLPLKGEQAWALCLLLLAYYGNLYYLLNILIPESAPWIGMGFSLLVLLLSQGAKAYLQRSLESSEAIATFVALTLAHSLYLNLIPLPAKPLFSLGLALVLFAIPATSTALSPSRLVVLGVAGYGALMTFVSGISLEYRLGYNFLFGAVALAAIFSRRLKDPSLASILLGFAHLEMLCALYRLSLKVEMSGSLFVSLTWGAYAILVLGWAWAKKDKAIGQSALLILVAVTLKATFYDLLQTGQLARVLSLLASGMLLYGCGWIFQRMRAWN